MEIWERKIDFEWRENKKHRIDLKTYLCNYVVSFSIRQIPNRVESVWLANCVNFPPLVNSFVALQQHSSCPMLDNQFADRLGSENFEFSICYRPSEKFDKIGRKLTIFGVSNDSKVGRSSNGSWSSCIFTCLWTSFTKMIRANSWILCVRQSRNARTVIKVSPEKKSN